MAIWSADPLRSAFCRVRYFSRLRRGTCSRVRWFTGTWNLWTNLDLFLTVDRFTANDKPVGLQHPCLTECSLAVKPSTPYYGHTVWVRATTFGTVTHLETRDTFFTGWTRPRTKEPRFQGPKFWGILLRTPTMYDAERPTFAKWS